MPVNLGAGLQIAADLLKEQRLTLSKRASARCFTELESYRRGEMPREESLQAVLRVADLLIDSLASSDDDSREASMEGSNLHDTTIKFD